MNMRIFSLLLLSILVFSACQEETNSVTPSVDTESYFPPTLGNTWETTSVEALGWETAQVQPLLSFVEAQDTRAFIVLKDGRIVIEEYFGKKFSGADFDKEGYWYWASAGKTLRAALVGIAQEEGYLNIGDATSKYLGKGWTSLPEADENKITIKHQLSMATGLDDLVEDKDCTEPACLQWKTAPNGRWAYHNGPYTLLEDVVAAATGQSFDDYFQEKIGKTTGINGLWQENGYNTVFYSKARSMARFGLLMLNEGDWNNTPIIKDKVYFNEMITPSQSLNEAYGYLWWLNGKSTFMVPVLQNVFNGQLSPNAPADMYAALGKNGQIISVVPSKNLIFIRMGETPDDGRLVSMTLLNDIWGELNKVIVED